MRVVRSLCFQQASFACISFDGCTLDLQLLRFKTSRGLDDETRMSRSDKETVWSLVFENVIDRMAPVSLALAYQIQ